MRLVALFRRCRALERRAAAVYHSFAGVTRDGPAFRTFWTSLSHEEEEHDHLLAFIQKVRSATDMNETTVSDCCEALDEVEIRMRAAEHVPTNATSDTMFSAALQLELSELDAVVGYALQAAGGVPSLAIRPDHAEGLARFALDHSQDPRVLLEARLVQVRARLCGR